MYIQNQYYFFDVKGLIINLNTMIQYNNQSSSYLYDVLIKQNLALHSVTGTALIWPFE